MELHGGEIEWAISERYGIEIDRILSFASTVSPIIPDGIHALVDRFRQLYLYPPRDPRKLKSAIASYEGLSTSDGIIVGSGSTELIHLFAQVFCRGEVIIPVPTYGEYEVAVTRYGKPIFVETKNNFDLSLNRIRRAISRRTRAIMVCNPNNPTGKLYGKDLMLELGEIARDLNVVLLVDEAYRCFSPSTNKFSMTTSIDSYPVFVLNSFSKLFGMPSLRIGWGIGSEDLIRRLYRFKVPSTTGNLAIWAAEHLLTDSVHQRNIENLISRQRKELHRQLNKISSLRVYPTDTNFILIQIPAEDLTSTEIFETLAKKGLVIRDCAMMRGLGNRFLRVTVRTPEDNRRLVKSLKEIFRRSGRPAASVDKAKLRQS